MNSSVLSLRARVALLAGLVLCALAVCLHSPPAAHANPQQLSIMMDDDLVVYAPDQQRMRVLQSMKNLGVDMVRATVLWNVVAQGTKNPATHHHFDPTNPRDYPKANWLRYDQLVQDAQKIGIQVYFNVTGPGPPWAMGKTSNKTLAKAWMPNASQFGKFVEAVGRRYSGTYPFGTTAGGQAKPGDLPKMSFWSIWNEPNWPTWLAPQNVFSHQLHRELPYAPILYRNLVYNALAGLKASGHTIQKGDFVMLGETQPLGVNPTGVSSPMRPGLFIRELFCVDSHLRPYTGTQAAARGCQIFNRRGPLVFSAFAHHPYTKKQPPTWVDRNHDSITLGNIAALPKLLDAIATRTHRLQKGVPIMATEMGYSTNPPNPFRGVSLDTQAAWINESDYLAYHQPRVFGMTQFEYRDSRPVKGTKKGSRAYWATFQTGITFQNGTPKPSYAAYALPIWVRAGKSSQGVQQLELWAQVRFRKGANSADRLVLQFEPKGSTTFTTIGSPLTLSPDGFVDVIEPEAPYAGGGTFRAVWLGQVPPFNRISRDVTFP